MKREVVFSPEADADQISLYDYIAVKSGTERAFAYVERIRLFCLSLNTFPERGTSYAHLFPGVRIVGFERRVSVIFRVKSQSVMILRILYGGRDLPQSLREK